MGTKDMGTRCRWALQCKMCRQCTGDGNSYWDAEETGTGLGVGMAMTSVPVQIYNVKLLTEIYTFQECKSQ